MSAPFNIFGDLDCLQSNDHELTLTLFGLFFLEKKANPTNIFRDPKMYLQVPILFLPQREKGGDARPIGTFTGRN
jgi:hypothetical protein